MTPGWRRQVLAVAGFAALALTGAAMYAPAGAAAPAVAGAAELALAGAAELALAGAGAPALGVPPPGTGDPDHGWGEHPGRPGDLQRAGEADEAEDGDLPSWRQVLHRAGQAARAGTYRGEVVWASWEGQSPVVSLVSVDAADAATPPAGAIPLRVPDPQRLTRKYDVAVAGTRELLDRPCAEVVIRDHHGSLRERLWVEPSSGALVRRESFEGRELRQLSAFVSLDSVGPGGPVDQGALNAPAADASGAALTPGAEDPSDRRTPGTTGAAPGALADTSATPVSARGVRALRASGWVIPEELPGGYTLEQVHAHGGNASPPLQAVYGDGLYSVSVFQQQGTFDPLRLPAGAEPTEDVLDGPGWEWPDDVPRRLVWASDRATFTLVGDPPSREFETIASALPDPETPSWATRIRRTLVRWVDVVSPWAGS